MLPSSCMHQDCDETYSLDFGIGLAVDEGPEHVSAKDVLLALDYEQRVPKLRIFTVHGLRIVPPASIQHM